MTAPILEITDLRTEIRLRKGTVHAVDGVSLTVAPGECLGIVGESGCGKSMTALSVMRLLPSGGHIAGGSIVLDGTDITILDEEAMSRIRGNTVGMVFQDPMTSLNPTMKIGDQIAESVRIHRGASKQEAMKRAVEVLGLVGMPRPAERIGNYPHQLSGGMRQRVMIAMALACEPKLLIADEPTTALDVTIQKQILELIDGLRERLGMAVILVTHDLGVIAGRADRVAVMYAGRIVETATTTELFANPRHRYTQALFEALPEQAGPALTRLYNIPGMPPDLTAPPRGCRFAARCRYVQEKCEDQEPEIITADGSRHSYRCWFPVEASEEKPQHATITASVPAARGNGEALLQLTNLVKNYSVTSGAVLQRKIGDVSAVADVSFAVPKGTTFGLVGESGCGKTTIGRLIVGLEKATGGSITFEGHNLARVPRKQRAERVQLMFQDSYAAMDPRMRVGTILREPLVIQGKGSRGDQERRMNEIVDEVGLPATALERYPHEFSGGQRQRLGLARALIVAPELIVADEPVSALDVSIQAQILNLMQDLQREHGLTYLFISHDLSVVRYMADVIGVMYLGKLVEVGPAEDVYLNPAHPYTKGLIDTVPVADPSLEHAKEHQGIRGELPSAIDPPSGCRFRTRCPLAEQICAEQEPPLRPFSEEGHQAACHFPLRQPLSLTGT
ncbi:MAG TPA: ABC transporter ATP-binding protein [Streptosporangiaceae bacterium]|nr:ABC transporter ATP-binding protein [Streptosporangiaceae bacterium]